MKALSTRPARREDVEQLLDLESARRKEYEQYSPLFWKEAEKARDAQRDYFLSLLSSNDEKVIIRVAEENGRIMSFAIGYIAESPSVYFPQKVCFVDDFPLAAGASWEKHGKVALEAVECEAKQRGASLTNVVCAQKDIRKRAFLEQRHLTVASEWWVGRIGGEK